MKKIVYSLILFFAFTLSALAEYNIVNDVGFNYGGDKIDHFYDLDFFDDGGYVAVGETESTFRNITNQGDHSDGVAAIFDKNNNLIKEWSWNNGEANHVEEFLAVKVIDNENILVLATDGAMGAHALKYKLDGTIVWDRTLTISSGEDYRNVFIYIEEDGSYLISPDTTTMDKVFRLDEDGNIIHSTEFDNLFANANKIVKVDDKYVVAGSNSVNGSLTLFDVSSSGDITNTKVFNTAPFSEIFDIDLLDNKLLLSLNRGTCTEDCVFGKDESNNGVIAIVDKSYNVVKYAQLGISSTISTNVLEDKIVVTEQIATTKSKIYYYDYDLNLLASYEYEIENGKVLFNNAKINPVNKKLYVAASFNAQYGNIANNGNYDGVIMSFNPVYAENQDDDEPIDIIDEDDKKDSLDPVEEKDTSTVENPKTGTFIGLGIGLLSIIIIIITLINKKKMYKI